VLADDLNDIDSVADLGKDICGGGHGDTIA
jgi:hypothetical protein